MIVHQTETEEERVLDKTWQEIYDSGFCVLSFFDADSMGYFPLAFCGVAEDTGAYYVSFSNFSEGLIFETTFPNGYPKYIVEPG